MLTLCKIKSTIPTKKTTKRFKKTKYYALSNHKNCIFAQKSALQSEIKKLANKILAAKKVKNVNNLVVTFGAFAQSVDCKTIKNNIVYGPGVMAFLSPPKGHKVEHYEKVGARLTSQYVDQLANCIYVMVLLTCCA